MSITIGPAFKLSKDADLFGLAKQLKELAGPVLASELFQTIHDGAVSGYDASEKTLPFEDFVKKEIENGCLCKPIDQYSIARIARNFTAYICRNEVRGEDYLLIPNAPSELVDAILALPGVEGDYSYYNSTDAQLEEISEGEWQDRYEAWKETVSFTQPVSKFGLSIDLSMPAHKMQYSDYLEHAHELTTLNEPARKRRIVRSIFMRKVSRLLPSEERMPFVMDLITSSLADAPADWPRVEEFASQLQEAIAEGDNVWEDRKDLA